MTTLPWKRGVARVLAASFNIKCEPWPIFNRTRSSDSSGAVFRSRRRRKSRSCCGRKKLIAFSFMHGRSFSFVATGDHHCLVHWMTRITFLKQSDNFRISTSAMWKLKKMWRRSRKNAVSRWPWDWKISLRERRKIIIKCRGHPASQKHMNTDVPPRIVRRRLLSSGRWRAI